MDKQPRAMVTTPQGLHRASVAINRWLRDKRSRNEYPTLRECAKACEVGSAFQYQPTPETVGLYRRVVRAQKEWRQRNPDAPKPPGGTPDLKPLNHWKPTPPAPIKVELPKNIRVRLINTSAEPVGRCPYTGEFTNWVVEEYTRHRGWIKKLGLSDRGRQLWLEKQQREVA